MLTHIVKRAPAIRSFAWVSIIAGALLVWSITVFWWAFGVIFYKAILVIFNLREPTEAAMNNINGWIGAMTAWLLFAVLLAASTCYAARKVDHSPYLHGSFIALLAMAAIMVTIKLRFPPILLEEKIAYPGFAAAGVAAGGWLAARGIRRLHIYNDATQRLRHATHPDQITSEMGRVLYPRHLTGIAIWLLSPQDSSSRYPHTDNFANGLATKGVRELWTSWSPEDIDPWAPGENLDIHDIRQLARQTQFSSRQDAYARHPGQIKQRDLPAAERKAWTRTGSKSAFFIGLWSRHGDLLGALVITTRSARPLSPAYRAAQMGLAGDAALVLENMILDERAKEHGKSQGVLAERERVSREVHDRVISTYSGIRNLVSLIRQRRVHNPLEPIEGLLNDISRYTREGTQDARIYLLLLELSHDASASLHDGIEQVVRQYTIDPLLQVDLTTRGHPVDIALEPHADVLAAVQAAFSNISDHSDATKVQVSIDYEATALTDGRAQTIDITIADNGVGFDPKRVREHIAQRPDTATGHGLENISYRLSRWQGNLEIESDFSAGTILRLQIPHHSVESVGKAE